MSKRLVDSSLFKKKFNEKKAQYWLKSSRPFPAGGGLKMCGLRKMCEVRVLIWMVENTSFSI